MRELVVDDTIIWDHMQVVKCESVGKCTAAGVLRSKYHNYYKGDVVSLEKLIRNLPQTL